MVPFLLWFILYFEAISKIQAPGGLYSEALLNGGFFAFRVWGGGAYIRRGLYMEGFIFGISQKKTISTPHHKTRHLERLRGMFWSMKALTLNG